MRMLAVLEVEGVLACMSSSGFFDGRHVVWISFAYSALL